MKKKFFFSVLAIAFIMTMGFSLSTVKADESQSSLESLFIEEDYLLKDPTTGKYAKDYSYLDNEKNLQLQRDLVEYYNNLPTVSVTSLATDKQAEQEELTRRVFEFIESFDPTFNPPTPGGISTFQYLDSQLSKAIEVEYHLSRGYVSPSEMAVALENSNGARDHATRYARERNWYTPEGVLKTWDNPSDTLRHFAWNYMNSNDLGVNKARAIGDGHELALIGAQEAEKSAPCFGINKFTCEVGYGLLQINQIDPKVKANLTTFNSYFDNSSAWT